jgi:hypothetical protein
MTIRFPTAIAMAVTLHLGSCASPYFVHDPQTLVVSREEVPRLLKSLRCEVATFIAVNNQRNLLFAAEAKLHGIEPAREKYQYFELDPKRFGTATLSLQVQDFIGVQNGTQADWLGTRDLGVHTHLLNIGPTGSDQSTYSATWNFVVPQDAITLHSAGDLPSDSAFACYAMVPKTDPPPFGSIYAAPDLQALARNDFPDYALFRRVWVDGRTPLAAWLGQIASSITASTLTWHNETQKPDRIIPAQMAYVFAIQVTGGLDVKYGLTSPRWPLAAVEGSVSSQSTNTIAITLNGIESYDWYLAQDGGALNNDARPFPSIKISGSSQPVPDYVGRQRPRGQPEWPGMLVPRTRSNP